MSIDLWKPISQLWWPLFCCWNETWKGQTRFTKQTLSMAIFHVSESHHGLVAWISWWSHTPTELGFDDRGKERGCMICDFCCLHFIVQMSEKGPSRYQFQRQCEYYICFLQKRSFTGNHWLTWIWNGFRRRAVHDMSNSLHILFHLCIYLYLHIYIYGPFLFLENSFF